MAKMRVFRCKRCGNVVQSFTNLVGDTYREDKCADPQAPGGYWYCDYVELVPKVKRVRKGKGE